MKIGVISDTHSLGVPQAVMEAFKNFDCIIHAGDFMSQTDFKVWNDLNQLYAVFGNMDDADLKEKLPETLLIECEGVRIGIYHGRGPTQGVLQTVKDVFKKEQVDVVVFGHSHHPYNEREGSVLYFNPGSPNDIVTAPYCSYGILTVNAKRQVKGKIVKC